MPVNCPICACASGSPIRATGLTGRRGLRLMELSVCVTDDDYEAWRAIRIAVVPDERCDTVPELARRLLGPVTAPRGDGRHRARLVHGRRIRNRRRRVRRSRVRREFGRRGCRAALLRALAEQWTGLGLPTLRASVDDEETWHSRTASASSRLPTRSNRYAPSATNPSGPPAAQVEVVTLTQHQALRAACFETFGDQVLADLATQTSLSRRGVKATHSKGRSVRPCR